MIDDEFLESYFKVPRVKIWSVEYLLNTFFKGLQELTGVCKEFIGYLGTENQHHKSENKDYRA